MQFIRFQGTFNRDRDLTAGPALLFPDDISLVTFTVRCPASEASVAEPAAHPVRLILVILNRVKHMVADRIRTDPSAVPQLVINRPELMNAGT